MRWCKWCGEVVEQLEKSKHWVHVLPKGYVLGCEIDDGERDDATVFIAEPVDEGCLVVGDERPGVYGAGDGPTCFPAGGSIMD